MYFETLLSKGHIFYSVIDLGIMNNQLIRSWPLCTQKNLRAGIYNILYTFYDTETFGDKKNELFNR